MISMSTRCCANKEDDGRYDCHVLKSNMKLWSLVGESESATQKIFISHGGKYKDYVQIQTDLDLVASPVLIQIYVDPGIFLALAYELKLYMDMQF